MFQFTTSHYYLTPHTTWHRSQPHLITNSWDRISLHRITSQQMTLITWEHITWHHIASRDITQHKKSHHIKWHDTTSHHMTWHLATNHITSPEITSQPTTLLHLTLQPTTSKQVTKSPPWNGWRLGHSKNWVWASQWLVTLCTFYRQILSLTYSFFFETSALGLPGSTCTYTRVPIRNLSSVSLVFFEPERVTGRAGHRLSSSLILAFTFV